MKDNQSSSELQLLDELFGHDAQNEFDALSNGAKTLAVEAEYTGKNKVRVVWGMNDALAFVHIDDSSGKTQLVTAAPEHASPLFQQSLTWLIRRQSMVNSSPHSPEYFYPDVNLFEFDAVLNEKFGTSVESGV